MDQEAQLGRVIGGPADGEHHGRYDFEDGAVLTLKGERYTLRVSDTSYVWVYSPEHTDDARGLPEDAGPALLPG